MTVSDGCVRLVRYGWYLGSLLCLAAVVGCTNGTPTRMPATAMLVAPATLTPGPGVIDTSRSAGDNRDTGRHRSPRQRRLLWGRRLSPRPRSRRERPRPLPPAASTATVISPATARPATAPATTGGHIYFSEVTDPQPQFHSIWWVKTDGTGAAKLVDGAAWPAISPDGKNLAFFQLGVGGKNSGLYVGGPNGGNALAAYLGAGVCCINWSHDGNWIVFAVSPRPSQPGGPLMMVKGGWGIQEPHGDRSARDRLGAELLVRWQADRIFGESGRVQHARFDDSRHGRQRRGAPDHGATMVATRPGRHAATGLSIKPWTTPAACRCLS